MNKEITLIYPHQLFDKHPALDKDREVILFEDPLIFTQFKCPKPITTFRKEALADYKKRLEKKGYQVTQTKSLAKYKKAKFHLADPVDNWMEKKLPENCELYQTPGFLLETAQAEELLGKGKSFFFFNFYKRVRKELNLLLTAKGEPKGGHWSFDADNRKPWPKGRSFPDYHAMKPSRQGAKKALSHFLNSHFSSFGPYEDAITEEDSPLHHSILTPYLNLGLITPQEVVDQALEQEVPIQSLEGFIRQVAGWREFVRATYEKVGGQMRTTNFWGHTRKIPKSFWDGTTGIEPVDNTIKKLLKHGWLHHIERLMVLSNFMLLCEFDPDEVYEWFMTLFVDAYDWVMVPNVYGMGLYADGGLITTKPYISGSNYIRKMSNYPKGEWCEIWDGLFWRFILKNLKIFKANHRLKLIASRAEKLKDSTKKAHIKTADSFLDQLK